MNGFLRLTADADIGRALGQINKIFEESTLKDDETREETREKLLQAFKAILAPHTPLQRLRNRPSNPYPSIFRELEVQADKRAFYEWRQLVKSGRRHPRDKAMFMKERKSNLLQGAFQAGERAIEDGDDIPGIPFPGPALDMSDDESDSPGLLQSSSSEHLEQQVGMCEEQDGNVVTPEQQQEQPELPQSSNIAVKGSMTKPIRGNDELHQPEGRKRKYLAQKGEHSRPVISRMRSERRFQDIAVNLTPTFRNVRTTSDKTQKSVGGEGQASGGIFGGGELMPTAIISGIRSDGEESEEEKPGGKESYEDLGGDPMIE